MQDSSGSDRCEPTLSLPARGSALAAVAPHAAGAAFDEPPDIDAYEFDGTRPMEEDPEEEDVFNFGSDMGAPTYQ